MSASEDLTDYTRIQDMLQDACDKHLPSGVHPPRINVIWDTISQYRHNSEKYPCILCLDVERDGSEIAFRIDFGNIIYDQDMVMKSVADVLSHMPSAVEAMMERRRNLTIHASTLLFILLAGETTSMRGWQSLQLHLERPLRARTRVLVHPRGVIQQEEDPTKLEWVVSYPSVHEMRLPGKRILSSEFRLDLNGDGKQIFCSYNGLRLNDKFPDAVLTKKVGKTLDHLIPLPSIQHAPVTIKGYQTRNSSTYFSLKSATLDMEDAFRIANKIISGDSYFS